MAKYVPAGTGKVIFSPTALVVVNSALSRLYFGIIGTYKAYIGVDSVDKVKHMVLVLTDGNRRRVSYKKLKERQD
jgi:hypothetical protein